MAGAGAGSRLAIHCLARQPIERAGARNLKVPCAVFSENTPSRIPRHWPGFARVMAPGLRRIAAFRGRRGGPAEDRRTGAGNPGNKAAGGKQKWRRERDSNPREAVSPYTISSRARSSTPAPLRSAGRRVIIPTVPPACPPEPGWLTGLTTMGLELSLFVGAIPSAPSFHG